VLAIVATNQVIKPVLWRLQMRRPYRAFFRVGDGTEPTTMRVRARSEVHIQVSRVAAATHLEQLFIVGFKGDAPDVPTMKRYENRFVAVGKAKSVEPEASDSHYIDVKGNYHIKEPRTLVRGNHYSSGFVVETKGPGQFEMLIMAITELGERTPSNSLTLIVEDAERAPQTPQ
jgi:hypothetical protein